MFVELITVNFMSIAHSERHNIRSPGYYLTKLIALHNLSNPEGPVWKPSIVSRRHQQQ